MRHMVAAVLVVLALVAHGSAQQPGEVRLQPLGATTNAPYITQTPQETLTNEQALSLLGSGIVFNTTSTGILSIYTGTSCPENQFLLSLNAQGVGTCAAGGAGGASAWGAITGTLSNQADLQTALDGKSPSGHSHAAASWGSITGTLSNQTDLQTGLDGKAALSHSHAQSAITGLVADLAAKAAVNHSHVKADVTDFAHTHLAADLPTATTTAKGLVELATDGENAASVTVQGNDARLSNARTPTAHSIIGGEHNGFPGGTTTFLRADGAFAAPSGGADPWTYVKVTGANFTTTSATAVDVTGLAFTPSANTDYEFEGVLMVRTATATVMPRAGLAWPTGMTDGVAMILASGATAVGAPQPGHGNIAAPVLASVGGLVNTTQSWPVTIRGMVRAGASPSGTVRVQLASETAGTTVQIQLGSFLRWRTIS